MFTTPWSRTRATLARAARPRLFEEILRLMRGGGAHRSIWLVVGARYSQRAAA